MNDPQIRDAFHRTFLQEHHQDPSTLVVNELGLEHGKCRADIAIINGSFIGYEIKSDVDSLKRLNLQIAVYNAVFDISSVVVTERHLDEAMRIVPGSWGIILAKEIAPEVIEFDYFRRPGQNFDTSDYSVAQLLWRNEAQEILMKKGVHGAQLRKSRALLYKDIIEFLTPPELRRVVTEYLRKRRGWRAHESPFRDGDLCQLHGNETGSPA